MTVSKLIVDCDPGMDDAIALLLAAAAPELELCAVTAICGNREVALTARNARRVLDFCDLAQVPVYRGASRTLVNAAPRTNLVHGEDGLGGAAFPLAGAIAEGFAADKLIDLIDGQCHVAAIDPLTNLALAEMRDPGVLARAASILIMGGAVFSHGNATPAADLRHVPASRGLAPEVGREPVRHHCAPR